jgi:FtsZ-binding cell division protein ZapB
VSDTPRTDAAIQRSCIDDLQCEWVEVDFARKLERDLKIANNWVEHHQNHVDDLIKENARLQMELDASCNAEEMRQVRAENAALRAEVDQWASRCAAAIWMLPETVTGGELRTAQDKFHRERENLRRENAAPRADKERLDSRTILLTENGDWVHHVEVYLRAAIDAAREAQP